MEEGILITKKEMEKALIRELEKNKEYVEVVNIVRKNTQGRIWLMGGAVSMNIIKSLYGYSQPQHDFDFLVKKLKENIIVPTYWKITRNRFNNPKLIKGSIEVDIVPLETVESILERKLKPTITNFLTGTPLDIQSLVFDIDKKELIGDLGIKALQRKEVRINNKKRFSAKAQRKGLTPQELLHQITKSLGFKPVFT